jgi:hypothetical protein
MGVWNVIIKWITIWDLSYFTFNGGIKEGIRLELLEIDLSEYYLALVEQQIIQ